MQLKIRFIPSSAAFFAGGFIISSLIGILFLPSLNTKTNKFVSTYGQALTSQAAKQAVDATFNHDLVRLQVILQDVIENPYTKMATIHDVENNLLVQAGSSRISTREDIVFTSPIVLHDSIAGYVSLTIEDTPWSFRSLSVTLTALGASLLALSIWTLLRNRALLVDLTRTPSNTNNDTEDQALEKVSEEAANDSEPVFAIIYIKNLDVLRQQLNGHNFRELIARLESVIADVMALYGGDNYHRSDSHYRLEFGVLQDRGEALFHAVCSAHLILELTGIIDKIPLDLSAMVSGSGDDIIPENLPFAGLIMEASAARETLIARRLAFMEIGTSRGHRVVSSFNQPFKTLLENQRKQLSQIL